MKAIQLQAPRKFAQLERESADLDAQINALSDEIRHHSETVQQLESEQADRTQRGAGRLDSISRPISASRRTSRDFVRPRNKLAGPPC